jgi:hypothetical protein
LHQAWIIIWRLFEEMERGTVEVKGGMEMWVFKGCPRCKGDLFLEEDPDRNYEKCLQCGYERELVRVAVKRNTQIAREKAGVI